MHQLVKRACVVVGALTVVTGTYAVQAATAAGTHDVREGDFIGSLSDTRSGGHYDFLKEGIRLHTDSNTSNDKVAEYFPLSGSLPSSGSYQWYGTGNGTDYLHQPGSQIVFDVDGTSGNSNDYNVLVGEQVYSANAPGQALTDWWLTNGSSTDAHNACPLTTGGSGSGCHGSLADWKAALPNAQLIAGGFSMGSGVQGDGVLRSLAYGDDTYVFTDEESAPASSQQDVTANYSINISGRNSRVTMTSDSLPANTTEGQKVLWEITVDNSSKFSDTMGEDETAYFRFYRYASSKNTIRIYKNGTLVKSFKN
jgi:hypothetical protein